MVVLLVELLPRFLVVVRWLAGELCGVVNGERRDSSMRKREMIGAEVVSLLRFGIGGNREVEAFGNRLRKRQYCGSLGSINDHIFGATPGIDRIVVQVDGS